MPSLDLKLLQKVRHHASGKIIARCPACAEAGADRTGNHLAIFPDGRFACAAHPGGTEHRRRIKALIGLHDDHPPDPQKIRHWQAQRTREHRRTLISRQLSTSVTRQRQQLIQRYTWTLEDLWEDSPQRLDSELTSSCPRHFLSSLFPPQAILWTGEVHQSGTTRHAARWKTCAEWLTTEDTIGPMTTPGTWKPASTSRTADNLLTTPYTVLDFDGFDGIKPGTPQQLHTHIIASLAIIRWLREALHWQLAAILHTGGKSLHAWFHTPSDEALQSLRDTAQPLGIDPGLIGHPEHPCRLPGQIHQTSRIPSKILWLDAQNAKNHPPNKPK